LTLGGKDDTVFIGRDLMKEKNYSESTAQMIDAETKRMVEDCHKRAAIILKKNKKFLKTMAEALLEREVLDSSEVDDILAGRKITPKAPPAVTPSNPPAPPSAAPASTPDIVLKPSPAPSQAIHG